jgi:hypothetical protein
MTKTLTATEITGTVATPAPPPLDFNEGVGTASPGYALPFLFAWVREDQTTFDETMLRVDEDIVDMEMEHDEGQVPTVSVTIKNDRRGGLLDPTRYQWAWIAYQPPNLDPYAAGVFSGPGDFTGIPNGYGSSGSTVNTPPALEGTPEYVVDGYVQKGYQVYDGATIPVVPPVPPPPNLGSSPSPSGGASGPPPYVNGNTVVPIFFGELIGVPDDLFAERITLKFLARSMNYLQWKQAVSETLRTAGNYDPVFLKNTERDNPDKILEGWSKLYHVDRCSLEVSASDVLVGEDGTVVFPESPPSAFYDSVKVKRGQAPLTNVQVQAQVHWTQRTLGYVDGPTVNVASYTGGTFEDEWPKGGHNLGAGWTVETSYVNDPYMTKHTPQWHIQTDIQMYGDMVDYDCAVVSVNESMSSPAILGPSANGSIYTTWQSGFCDPGGNPLGSVFGGSDPVNIPSKVKGKVLYIPLWNLSCQWTLQYKAKREFTEYIYVDVTANTQSILTSPTVQQDTERITMNGEVGQPILIYDAWTDFENSYVAQGTLIYPNDPTRAGGLSYQVAINNGVAGKTEPTFSDIPGAITHDGTVQWASLGETPQSQIQEMAYATSYNVGTILNYTQQVFDPNQGALVPTTNSQYFLVVKPCSTTNVPTRITYTPPASISDELLFGIARRTIFIEQFAPPGYNIVPGPIGYAPAWGFSYLPETLVVPLVASPTFLGIPAGGTTDNVTARCYFPTPRGRQSVVYAINRARAKIRMRSRAVEVSWECPIEMVLGMSCRMNATLYDPRLPGGVATGKVIKYGISAKKGKIRGKVTIGCSVGHNAFGSPEADISYTAPVFEPFDDGLNFPLRHLPSDGGSFTETLENQLAALEPGIAAELQAMAIENPPDPIKPTQGGDGGVTIIQTGVGPSAMWRAKVDAAMLSNLMEGYPIGWVIEIDSVTNGPFNGAYTINATPLELPMGIDLSASSENL